MNLEQAKLILVNRKVIYPTNEGLRVQATFLKKVMDRVEQIRGQGVKNKIVLLAVHVCLVEHLRGFVDDIAFKFILSYVYQTFFNTPELQAVYAKLHLTEGT